METKEMSGAPVGIFHLVHRDVDGSIIKEWSVRNKMTNASLAVITGLVTNVGSQLAFTYIALGSGTTPPAASQTALVTEFSTIGLSRVSVTPTRTTTSQTNDTAKWEKLDFAVSGSGTVEEIGIFNNTLASGTSVMLCRALTGSTAVSSGQTLGVSYTWQAVGN